MFLFSLARKKKKVKKGRKKELQKTREELEKQIK